MAIWSQPHILARCDYSSAPLTNLAGGMCLIVLRIDVLQLPVLAVVFRYLALGRFLAILRQDALGPLPEAIGLLPHALFLAVLRHHGHRAPIPRDPRASPWHSILTLTVATNSDCCHATVLLGMIVRSTGLQFGLVRALTDVRSTNLTCAADACELMRPGINP